MSLQVESNERGLPENDLTTLYRSWGVFDLLCGHLDKLSPERLKILNIARNLLDGKPIPGLKTNKALTALTKREPEITYEKRPVTRTWTETITLPAEEPDMRPIADLTEISKVPISFRLLEEFAPEYFLYQAVTHGLPVMVYKDPKVVTEERSETVEELVPIERAKRQKVYALLDNSPSMKDHFKFFTAKAIMMAYLARAYEEESEFNFRFFNRQPSERIDCVTKNQYENLARYILNGGYEGGTNIPAALETAITDIRRIESINGESIATTEILLITDGGSTDGLPQIPQNVLVHTLHLQDGSEHRDFRPGVYAACIRALRNLSNTYVLLNPSDIMLPAGEEDVNALREELNKGYGAGENPGQDGLQKLEKARQMTTAYRKMYGGKESKEVEKRVRQMEKQAKKDKRETKSTEQKSLFDVIREFIIKLAKKELIKKLITLLNQKLQSKKSKEKN